MQATKKYLGSITLRFPIEDLIIIDKEVTDGKFSDRSDAIRSRYLKGIELESLIEIQQDPERKAQFEVKLQEILKNETMEQFMDTCDETVLRAIRFYADAKLNAKVKQEILNLKAV